MYDNEIINQMMDRFGQQIDELGNVRAMIDYKFFNQTESFFLWQMIAYTLLDIIPFATLLIIDDKNDWIFLLLNINMLGEVLF